MYHYAMIVHRIRLRRECYCLGLQPNAPHTQSRAVFRFGYYYEQHKDEMIVSHQRVPPLPSEFLVYACSVCTIIGQREGAHRTALYVYAMFRMSPLKMSSTPLTNWDNRRLHAAVFTIKRTAHAHGLYIIMCATYGRSRGRRSFTTKDGVHLFLFICLCFGRVSVFAQSWRKTCLHGMSA